MKDLYELKKMLCETLEEYGRARDLTSGKLQTIDTLAHACKNVCKIIESCEEEEAYSSNGGMNRGYGRSYGNGRYSGDGYYYDDGMSYRRGRAANGRFVSRDGSELARQLRQMMEDAPDASTRSEIQRLADKMETM